MNSLGLFLAAVAVAAIPMLWFEMEKHLSLLPEREWSFTASLLIVLPGTTGLVLISVPFTPEIEWARPDMFGIFLMLATSPVLWGLGILIGVFSHLIGFVI